jgi:hypothetical protein
MKICPKCQKTYNDEALNFCLDDGTVLNPLDDRPKIDESLPETVMISPPRSTSPNQSLGGQTPPNWGQPSQNPWGQQPQQNWGTAPSMQGQAAPAKSRSWLWVLGILAAVVVLCGGGLVGLVVLVSNVDTKSNSSINAATPEKSPPKLTSGEKFEKFDMSVWTNTDKEYATAEFNNGEYTLQIQKKGFYYVLVTKTNFKTDGSITRISLRSSEGNSSEMGYGLIFHSNPKPLTQDYGFLINAEKKRYRVVKHSPGKETEVVSWKDSDSINGGTATNTLEVRDKNGTFDLFINGDLVETIKNTDGYKGGVPGIYAGDAVKIVFSNLEVGK